MKVSNLWLGIVLTLSAALIIGQGCPRPDDGGDNGGDNGGDDGGDNGGDNGGPDDGNSGLTGKFFAWGNELTPGDAHQANIHQGSFPQADSGADGFTGIAAVAQFPPNGYGVYDIAGNVWEWVSDWYRPDYYATLAATGGVALDPAGPAESFDPAEPGAQKRVQRGGSFLCTDQYCSRYMVGTRGKGEVSTGSNHLGFRAVAPAGRTRPGRPGEPDR